MSKASNSGVFILREGITLGTAFISTDSDDNKSARNAEEKLINTSVH